MATRIAIIEDDQSIAQMYKLKFEAEGNTVGIANNGVLGLKLIKEMKPDIILLDIMMPEMSGDEMLEKLQKTAWGKDVKVIVLTNVGGEEIPASMKQNGVTAVAQKADLTPSQVMDIIKENLK